MHKRVFLKNPWKMGFKVICMQKIFENYVYKRTSKSLWKRYNMKKLCGDFQTFSTKILICNWIFSCTILSTMYMKYLLIKKVLVS